MSLLLRLKNEVKNGKSLPALVARRGYFWLRDFSFPVIPVVHRALYSAHVSVKQIFAETGRILWFTPLFKSRLIHPPRKLYLYSGLPLILGHLQISIGEGSRISGQSTFSGRSSTPNPQLIIGKNVDIGWQTSIAVGTRVIIHDDVRLAGRAFLAGYPGHPLNNEDRAKGLPDLETQIGDIILEQGVWLATGVTVSAGVTIGKGTIVAAGSVVTKSLPPFVLAAGVPAQIIRSVA
jgi:acetyltransferase-like isoleucine patch superfamily enzyme